MPKAKIKLDLENTPLPERLRLGRLLAGRIAAKPAGFAKSRVRAVTFLAALEAVATPFNQRAEFLAHAAGLTPTINTADTEFKDQYGKLATDIEDDTNNDEGAIKDLDLAIREVGGGATTAMPQVENLHVSDGEGTDDVDLTWNAVRLKSLRNFVIRHCPDINAPVWTTAMEFPTTSKATVKSLPTGMKQWFQVAANGPDGLGPWSEPVAGTPV